MDLHKRIRNHVMAISVLTACAMMVMGCSGGDPGGTPKAADVATADSSTADSSSTGDGSASDALDPGADASASADSGPVTGGAIKLLAITPASGKASGGETITLTGTGFDETTQVLFGGTPIDVGNVFVVDTTTLQVKTPPHETGLVDVAVVAPGDTPITSTMANGFLFFNDLVITLVTPAEGPVGGGTAVTLQGTGFAGKTTVLFGGKPAIGVQVLADNQLIAVTPPGTFGAATVHVVNERGAGLQKKGFFYTMAPVVQSLDPAAGPTAGGTTTVVHGHGLTKEASVLIGGSPATVMAVTGESELQVVTPPGQTGKADVSVTTKYGTVSLSGGYVYTDDQGQAATQILSIAPAQGPLAGGNTVAIIATGLISAADTTVLFGDKSATIQSVSPGAHTALVTVPAGQAAGAIDVVMMTSKGSDKAVGGYTYSDKLSISTVNPPVGPLAGGTTISIVGNGFGKGKPAVKVGALAATDVKVISDTEISAVTPPGQPGYVDVAVKVGTDLAVASNAFSYTGSALQIYVPYPNAGAQAGGTQVRLYGTGFTADTQVYFGGNPATHFTFIDATQVVCKTPAGKVGSVDVQVTAGKETATLVNGYNYFNPMSAYGGTWGSEVDGSINLTVIDASNFAPVPDAFAMLWTDPTTPYQGFTNADGQITFSGDNLAGKQMVSASKVGYESASVVLFNAANVTLLIHPIPPPSSGSPPPGDPQPNVSGHVIGLDKYVFIPIGNCDTAKQTGSVPAPACNFCVSDSDCGGGDYACMDVGGGNGKRCLQACTASCPDQFKCQPLNGSARCVPVAGEAAAVCYHSKDTYLSQDHNPAEGAKFVATPANDYTYTINTGFGEQAIVCFGGYKQFGSVLAADDPTSLQAFTPLMMGVKRHVVVQPTVNPNTGKKVQTKMQNVDVTLTIPLTATAQLRMDKPPVWKTTSPNSLIFNAAYGVLVLGSDGAITMPAQDLKFAQFSTDVDQLSIKQLPSALQGDIADASLTFVGLVVEYDQLTQSQMPVSITIKNDVKTLTNDSMVRRNAGSDFEVVDTGISKNIYGLWGSTPNNLYAVGAQGTLVHWDGGAWSAQATITKEDLLGVYGTDASHVWVVGANSAAGSFDGTGWKTVAVQSTGVNFTGVFAASDGQGGSAVYASSTMGTYNLGSIGGVPTWIKSPNQFANFRGVHGSDKDHVWAVGMTGQIAMWTGSTWKSQVSGTAIALNAVWAASPTSVYAVGEAGQILHFDGSVWKPMASPIKTTLVDVFGTSESDIWAVGERGALLHYNGQSWVISPIKDVDKSLNAVWASAAGDLYSLGEQELLMTPILYPPLDNTPKKDPSGAPSVLIGNTLKWDVDPLTPEPHFNYVTIGIPGMGPDTPVWNITTKGSVNQVDLPDFPAIQGTPGIPAGTVLRLTVIRAYKEGFDIDHYDEMDFDNLTWRAWAVNEYFFTRQ